MTGRVEMRSRTDRIVVKKNNVNSRTDLGREWKRISCVRGNEMRGMKKNNKIKNNNNSYRGSKGCKTILQLQRGTGMKILVRFTRKFTSWIYENLNLTYFAFLDEYSLGRIIDHWNIFLFVIHNFVSSRATVVKLHYKKEKRTYKEKYIGTLRISSPRNHYYIL